MKITLIYSIYSGFVLSCIVSFAHVFSSRVSEAFYQKTRKAITKKWEYILSGRSQCDHCGSQLPLLYVFPLFGYFISTGKCKECGHPVSKAYLVEEYLAFFYGFIAFFYSNQNFLFFFFICIYFFLSYLISYIDFRHYLIPTQAWVTFILAGLVEYFLLKFGSSNILLDFSVPLSWSLLFLLLAYLQPEKLGFADIYLVGVFTFAAGFPASLFLPTVASFIAIIYFFTRYRNIPWESARKNKIPFGLFLSLAFLLLKIIPIQDILL